MWNRTQFQPTQSHRVSEEGKGGWGGWGGAGQTAVGTSRWGTVGCGSETRPSEDKSNAPFIMRCHARSGRTEEGERRSRGAKVKQTEGETRLEGGFGAGRVGQRAKKKVTGCRSCTPVRRRACSRP